MNIAELLPQHARDLADRAAIVQPARAGSPAVITFAQLERRTSQAAALLRRHGLGPGGCALLLVPLSIETYVAMLALFRIGATAVFLDPSAGRSHVDLCCRSAAPDALIASPKAHLLRLLVPALRRIPLKFSTGWTLLPAHRWHDHTRESPDPDIAPADPAHPALLTFTSGSTGEPKGVIRTHAILHAQHRALEAELHPRPGDASLVTLGVFTLTNLASGITSVLADADLRRPGEIDPAPVLAQLGEHRITTTVASPAFLRRLADAGRPLNTLRRIYTGGAPVFPDDLDAFAAAAPDADITLLYGSTEAEPIASLRAADISPDDRAAIARGGGLPAGNIHPAAQVRILRDPVPSTSPLTEEAFASLCLPRGEAGEIVVSGPHVVRAYLNGRGESETKLRVGDVVWHRTGDAGRIDADGRLWLLGRCSARLAASGPPLYPLQIEAAARQHTQGRRCVAVEHAGRRLLILERRDAVPAAEAHALRETLAWARLDEIATLPKIPLDRRHQAKIDYPELRRRLGSA